MLCVVFVSVPPGHAHLVHLVEGTLVSVLALHFVWFVILKYIFVSICITLGIVLVMVLCGSSLVINLAVLAVTAHVVVSKLINWLLGAVQSSVRSVVKYATDAITTSCSASKPTSTSTSTSASLSLSWAEKMQNILIELTDSFDGHKCTALLVFGFGFGIVCRVLELIGLLSSPGK